MAKSPEHSLRVPAGRDATRTGAALRRGLQARRYAGSGDRQAISALFWSVHRSLARLSWHLGELGQDATGRALVLAGLCLGLAASIAALVREAKRDVRDARTAQAC